MDPVNLYHFPTACSWVTQCALEAVEMPYDLTLVDIDKGEQKSAAFTAINPKGKVPALAVSGELVTENPAIIYWLSRRGNLASVDDRTLLVDLAWCGGTLHPMVRQIRAPQRFTDGPIDEIRQHGIATFRAVSKMLEERFRDGWWYGETWSIVDTYLSWIVRTASTHADLASYSAIARHQDAIHRRPETIRAASREAMAREVQGWPPVSS